MLNTQFPFPFSLFCLLVMLVGFPIYASSPDGLTIIYINKGDRVRLELDGYHAGAITWEESNDRGHTWNPIAGANGRNFELRADSTSQFRARIANGTCNPIYSYNSAINVIHSTIIGLQIADTSVTIECLLRPDTFNITETGLMYDIRGNLGLISPTVRLTQPHTDTFSFHINGLQAGTVYSARTYAIINDSIKVYGTSATFTTYGFERSVWRNATDSSAVLRYRILGASPDVILEHGVLYSTDSVTIDRGQKAIGFPGSGELMVELQGLHPETQYFTKHYFHTETDTFYSDIQGLKTFSKYNVQVDDEPSVIAHKIVWDNASKARKISQDGVFADYGRVKRYLDTDTLLLVYHGGPNNGDWVNVYFRRSLDNGLTWENHVVIREQAQHSSLYWRFCNPELLVLQNGWILLAYEANTKGDENNSSVQILTSKDGGSTWSEPLILRVGRSWEPAMVQLPAGEIELFWASEAKWWPSVNGSYIAQEIMMSRSTDNGQTWSDPLTVAYYPDKRDGMPVPLLLQGNKGVVFAIETVNNHSPYIIWRPINEPWTLTTNNFDNSPYRWFVGHFDGHGGAPYIVQLHTGETVMSVHRYRGGVWTQNNDMKVMIGDSRAQNFGQLTTPYVIPFEQGAVNNSLFVKDSQTIVAISCRRSASGSGGIYWLEGSIVPK